eukprot:1159852-Pelagomonas_calceolata.AAC.5
MRGHCRLADLNSPLYRGLFKNNPVPPPMVFIAALLLTAAGMHRKGMSSIFRAMKPLQLAVRQNDCSAGALQKGVTIWFVLHVYLGYSHHQKLRERFLFVDVGGGYGGEEKRGLCVLRCGNGVKQKNGNGYKQPPY